MMMMMRTLPGVTSSAIEHVSCQSNPSSPTIARAQYGLPRSQASRLHAVSNSTSLKITLTCNKLSFNPFLAGELLGLSSCVKIGPAVRRAPVHKICAQAADASASDAYPEGSVKAGDVEVPKPAMGRVKIGIYFATWWALNVVFNIYNKKVLNAFPFPWLTSALSLAMGSVFMLSLWGLRLVEPPDVDAEFWKGLAPVAILHTIGFVAATVSLSKIAVSSHHIIKSLEPACSVIISKLFMGEDFPLSVYFSIVPIIGGCGLAAASEVDFSMIGFLGAMLSNIAFVFRNIASKRGMKAGKSVGGMNYYACLSMMSFVLLLPFAFVVEGPKVWAAGWTTAIQSVGRQFPLWVVLQCLLYHLHNQVSYMSLDQISPLSFSIGNTMKRVTVIATSILIFRNPVSPINAIGAAIAILGTFFYSQAK